MVVFWKEVDEYIQHRMGRFTDIEVKRTKHDCVWDMSESVIYSVGKVRIQILAKAQKDEVCIQFVFSNKISMVSRDFTGKFSTEFQSSDLKSTEGEELFLRFLASYTKTIVVLVAIEHFCTKNGYLMEYYVGNQDHYTFYIYKHKKSYSAKLRIFIGIPAQDEYLGVILFHETFYISMEAHPKMVDAPPCFKHTADLYTFIENTLKNTRPSITINQLLWEKMFFWDECCCKLDSLPLLDR